MNSGKPKRKDVGNPEPSLVGRGRCRDYWDVHACTVIPARASSPLFKGDDIVHANRNIGTT